MAWGSLNASARLQLLTSRVRRTQATGTRREILQTGGRALGEAIAFAVNLLDPEAVILGGGVGLNDRTYRLALETSMRSHIWLEETRALPLLDAALGAHAGVVGAAARPSTNHPWERRDLARRRDPRRSPRRPTRCTSRCIPRSPTRSGRVDSALATAFPPNDNSASSST